MKQLITLIVALVLTTSAISAKGHKALIVTGQHNHNWQVSSVILQELMQRDENFAKVDIAISPSKGEDMSLFRPKFKSYDLVVFDYNGDYWSEECMRDFERYLNKKGVGVVIYHGANNSFHKWECYESTIALGGWEGRGVDSPGVYVEWKDGKVVKYEARDKVGHHGKAHEYEITARTPEHPICKGLPTKMMQSTDELYDYMKGVGNIKDLLYTAYSDPQFGGTGKEEPMIFTVEHPKARIFHTMLGHAGKGDNPPAMASETFKNTFMRGALWCIGALE